MGKLLHACRYCWRPRSRCSPSSASAEETFVVAPQTVADEKAVFATVESANVVPARARIGGTVVELAVQRGDHVEQDQVVATVADEKLALQIKALDAQIAGLQAELAKAKTDLDRAQELFAHGTTAKATLDAAQTAFDVATNSLKSRTAERSVIEQQVTRRQSAGADRGPRADRAGDRPAPSYWRGSRVATIAEQNFVLRLRVPERHARFLKAGDPVRIDGEDLGKQRRAIRHHQPRLSADRGRPRDRRCESCRSRRLFRRPAHPRLGVGR